MQIDFSKSEAKDILVPSSFAEYDSGMKFFYSELVHLNTNIYIIDRIKRFPFDAFFIIYGTVFFSLVVRNFFEISILIITRLAADPSGDSITLTKFKNRVRQLVRPEYKQEFSNFLKEVRFDSNTKDMLRRARNLRHSVIAHSMESAVFNIEQISQLTFSELESLRDVLNSLLKSISFNVGHLMLPLPYADRNIVRYPADLDNRSDIERLLDSVVKDSSLLDIPEKSPDVWSWRREQLTEEELRIFNEYRIKFNLPEV